MKNLAILYLVILIVFLPISLTISCRQTEEEAPPKDTLLIRSAEVCFDVRGDRDYTVQPGATFNRGERVWVYFEARGITSKKAGDKFEVWTTFSDAKLYDPNNHIIEHVEDIADFHDMSFVEPVGYCWYYVYYDIEQTDSVGQYRFEFTVTDELSGAIGTGSTTFSVK